MCPFRDDGALNRALFDSHPDPSFTLDPHGVVTAANRAFGVFTGRPAAGLVGHALTTLVAEDARDETAAAVARVLGGGSHAWQAEFVGPGGTASIAYVTLVPLALDDGEVGGAQGVARDVTVYRVIEEQLQERLFTDPVTGLGSRAQLLEGVDRAVRASVPGHVALLHLDVDDFRAVNDGLGRAAGDLLLTQVADRLRRATRGCDLVARLEGDEFAVLLEGLPGPEEVHAVVERVRDTVRLPLALDARATTPHEVTPTVCLGVAHWDGDAPAAELVRNAGIALAEARSRGKGSQVVYESGMHAAARARVQLAADLREAVRRALAGEADAGLWAAYQPIVSVSTRQIVKAEALARWTHPVRGPISPGEFIPLAEEGDVVADLGRFMLCAACGQLRAWDARAAEASAGGGGRSDAPLNVAVNVSGRHLEEGTLVRDVRHALEQAGVTPERLTIELTESVAMRHPERVLPMLHELATIGVQLAIDDFGTGYSSLAYLHRFPVHVLKIDKSFVDRLVGEPRGDVLARAMVGLAGALDLQTVAEGVETEAQHARLLALGCPLGQGWLYGRPVAGDQFPVVGVTPRVTSRVTSGAGRRSG